MSEAFDPSEVRGVVSPSPSTQQRKEIANIYNGVDPYNEPNKAFTQFQQEWSDFVYGRFSKVEDNLAEIRKEMTWQTVTPEVSKIRSIAFADAVHSVLQQLLSVEHRHLLASLLQYEVRDPNIAYAVTKDGDIITNYLIPKSE